LILTNISAVSLSAGDSFRLFSAASFTGSFKALAPAIPGINLGWNTNTLASDGTVRVVSAPTAQPRISDFEFSGANLILSGTNGVPGWTFYVLASTNLALPIASWPSIATNQFDDSGAFSITNAADLSLSCQFFILELR